MATIYKSIWEDTFYETTESPFVYTIRTGDEVIFAGKAYRYPDAEVTKVNINKICENYLHQDMETFFLSGSTAWSAMDGLKDFKLYDEDGVLINTYWFLCDWSYDNRWRNFPISNISQPICDDYANGMIKFKTAIGLSGSTPDPYLANIAEGVSAGTLNCVDYALYYVDSFGGLDSFAIQGATVKSDAITAYSTDRAYDNNLPEFETMRNISEIKTSYELNTHYLTDEQSENLAKNLIGSNLVYLHNLKDGTIKPVVIDDKAVTYQTYQTNGKKLAQYKIKVTESQIKRRRR